MQSKTALDIHDLESLVQSKISSLHHKHILLSQSEVSYLQHLEALQKNILFYEKEGPSFEKFNELQKSLLNLEDQFSKSVDLPDAKTERFTKKKLGRYAGYLSNNQDVISEATEELAIIVKTLLTHKNPLSIMHVNQLGEIEVMVNKEPYNLKQILAHEPNLSQLNLSDKELDAYLQFLQSQKAVFTPLWFYVPTNGDSKSIMQNLNDYLVKKGKDNHFVNCHAGEVLSFFQYTDIFYPITNTLLRFKNIPLTLFEEGSQDPVVQRTLEHIELTLTGAKGHAVMTADQHLKLVLEGLLATAVMANGLNKCTHLCYLPSEVVSMQQNKLDTKKGQSLRALSGPVVEAEKRRCFLSFKTGIPLSAPGFQSSSFDTGTVSKFAGTLQGLVIKTHPWSGISKFSVGAFIAPISRFPDEEEYLFPPCLRLPQPITAIKHKAHYGPIIQNEKITMVMVNGNSPQSFLYSKEIQRLRSALLAKYQQLSQLQLVGHKANTLRADTMISIYRLVNSFDSQLKRIKIGVIPSNLTLQDIKNMDMAKRKNVDATVLVSESGKVYIIDDPNLEEAQLSPVDHAEMTEIFKLKSNFASIKKATTAEIEEIDQFCDIYEIAYLSEVTGVDINPVNDPQTTINRYKNQLAAIESNFNLLINSPPKVGAVGLFGKAGQGQAQPSQSSVISKKI